MAAYLIVNADDFNLTEGVTRGILEAHLQGIVTSTTALVNLPGLERSRELAGHAPRLAVGLHVNLTFGPPVLPAGEVASLVDEGGRFIRDPSRLEAAGDPAEIRAEVAAQVERFHAAFNRRPSHLDSHHHVHRHTRVFEAVLSAAADLGMPLRAVSPEMAASIRGRGLACPDRLVGDVGPEAYWQPERLLALLGQIQPGVTEVMCHPGHVDTALSTSSYCAQREGELRAFCDPAVKAALQTAGIQCITYDRLAAVLRSHA